MRPSGPPCRTRPRSSTHKIRVIHILVKEKACCHALASRAYSAARLVGPCSADLDCLNSQPAAVQQQCIQSSLQMAPQRICSRQFRRAGNSCCLLTKETQALKALTNFLRKHSVLCLVMIVPMQGNNNNDTECKAS